ncbi:MAG: hypothetical protein J5764_02505 [Bacteroidales bacterium]|nr:hypothetical protein [Bacteroidales bacterium]
MKKILTITIALAALLAPSCRKVDDGSDIDKSGFTVFRADTEELEIESGVKVSDTWADGDMLGVFGSESGVNEAYVLKRSGVGKAEAAFYGPLVKGGKVTAYFPYADDVALQDGLVPFWLNPVQTYDAESGAAEFFKRYCNLCVASTADDATLHFRYPLGMLEIQIRFDETVSVSGMSVSSDSGIAGRLLAAGDGSSSESAISAHTVSLDFGGVPVQSRTADGFAAFRFVLRPGVYPAKSLVLNITALDEEITVRLGETVVERVKGNNFNVTTVVVGTSDIPGFNKEDGYLE